MHWLWLGFFGLVGVLLLLQRKMLTATNRPAAYSAAAWFGLGLLFVVLVYPIYGHAWLGAILDEPSDRPGADASMKFVSAYLLEYVLAFDNLLVISLLFRHYRVPKPQQPRVLFWGLVLGTALRVVVLSGVTSLARAFDWAFYMFGALVVYSGLMALKPDTEDEKPDALARILGRMGRLARGDHGGSFWVIQNGRRALTMVAMCLLSGVLVEVFFALDSVAVLSVSTTTFVVVTSNVLATIALRGWFPLLDTVQAIRFPRKATVALLVVVGIKIITHHHVLVPPAVVLAVIGGFVLAAVGESLVATRRARSR